MILKSTKTGVFLKSRKNNCPIFIPNKLISSKVNILKNNKYFINSTTKIDESFNSIFKVYLYKFIAGNKSLHYGFADIAVQDLFLCKEVRIATSTCVSTVVNAINIFDKEVEGFKDIERIKIENLIKCNRKLRPNEKKYGIRSSVIIAGNIKKNKYSFYCVPPNKIEELMDDFIVFYNEDKSILNKILIGMMQFINIHPFKDGNGRISRVLFLSLMQKHYGCLYSSIFFLYLKNINRMNYFEAMYNYRNGDTIRLKKFYLKAISWTNTSVKVMEELMQEYKAQIKPDSISMNPIYSQIVVKVEKSEQLDSTIFKLHTQKGKNSIYLNTALLNVLNQFDYYLRFELRACLSKD